MPEIKAQLEAKAFAALKDILNNISSLELAEGWKEFSSTQQVLIFRLLRPQEAVYVFEELDRQEQEFLMSKAFGERFDASLHALASEGSIRFFPPMPLKYFKALQVQLRKQKLPSFTALKDIWPADSAGALMKHEYFCADATWTVKEVLKRIQATMHVWNTGELYSLYVIDTQGCLLGVLSLRTLIAAPPDIKVTAIMWPVGLIKVRPETDQEEVTKLFRRYDLMSLPVVNESNKLLGTIVVDDILDVMHKEATEDIALMAGTQAAEITRARIRDVIFLRMPWLIITCAGQFLVAHTIRHFEDTLARFIALASFMPFIAAMGGNVGTQSSTIAVRAFATGEWGPKDFSRVIFREL
ncbi:MAG: magnesium transporter, partial [Elusimicrobiota bacterium]